MKHWLIYGANGYTGRLIALQAKRSTWAVELHLRHYEEFGMEFIQ